MHAISEEPSLIPILIGDRPFDLRQRILKLRWIGMDDEAERLSHLMAQSAEGNIVLIEPRETD